MNRIKNSLLWIFVVFSAPALAPPLQAGVIAHWRFEEGVAGTPASGANSILDSSGNGLHLTPLGSPLYQNSPVQGSNLGLDLDGVNDLASRADNVAFQTKSLTIEAYVRYDGGLGLRQIVFRGDGRGGDDPFYLAFNNGKLRFQISDITTDRFLDATNFDVTQGALLHIAATLDDASDMMKIFVNGSEIASRQALGTRPNVPLFSSARVSVGGLDDGLSRAQHLNGFIDEVRLSNVALNPSQFLGAAAVPEPQSSMMFLGLIGLMLKRRRTA